MVGETKAKVPKAKLPKVEPAQKPKSEPAKPPKAEPAQISKAETDKVTRVGPAKLPKATRLYKSGSVPLTTTQNPPPHELRGKTKAGSMAAGPVNSQPASQDKTPLHFSEAADSSDASGTQADSEFDSSEGKSVVLVATSPSEVAWKRMRRGSLRKQEICTTQCFFKYLIVLGCLQGLSVLAWGLTFLLCYFYYPILIISKRLELRDAFDLNKAHIAVLWVLGLQPVYTLILFCICLPFSKKNPKIIRIYYVIATWAVPVLVLVFIMILFFIGKLTTTNIVKEMTFEILNYDDGNTEAILLKNSSVPVDELSHESIDQIQIFFKCCGIKNHSDWRRIARGFFDEEDKVLDPKYWIVPVTCCSTTVDIEIRRCVQDPDRNPKLLWKTGCLRLVSNLLRKIGIILGVIIFFNCLFQIWTIGTATCYYASTRTNDGTGYASGFTSFAYECCFVHVCKRQQKPTRRRHASVLPINARPDDILEAEASLVVLEREKVEERKREAAAAEQKRKLSMERRKLSMEQRKLMEQRKHSMDGRKVTFEKVTPDNLPPGTRRTSQPPLSTDTKPKKPSIPK